MIALIAAVAQNRVIGRNQRIPWRIPGELAYFRRMTWGQTVVMGRRTFESIGRPLPGRNNCVLSRNPAYQAPGITAVHDPRNIVELSRAGRRVFIIGGSDVFALFLNDADRFYETLIEREIAGDTFFPAWHREQWDLTSSFLGSSEVVPHRYNLYTRQKSCAP